MNIQFNNFNKISLLICHISILISCNFAQNISHFIPGSTGIRIRLNEPLFNEAATIFQRLFSYHVQTVVIPQQQQCFPEGCFSLYNFRVTSFSQPRSMTLKPLTPNYLFLNILMFDLDIVGTISGNLQIVLSVPISGGILIIAKSLSISATLDLQKNQFRQPYLRVSACELRGGYIDAKVTDLGLLTDSINFKYKQEMIGKAREVIQSTICSNLELIIKTQVNEKLGEIPKAVAVSDIMDYLDKDKILPEKIRTRPNFDVQQQQSLPQRVQPQHQPQLQLQQQSLQVPSAFQYQPIPSLFGSFYYQRRWKRQNDERNRRGIQRRGIARIEEITPSIAVPQKRAPTPPPPSQASAAAASNTDADYDLWGNSGTDINTSENSSIQKQQQQQQQIQNLRVKHFPSETPVISRPSGTSRREQQPPSARIEPLPQGDASLAKLLKLVDAKNLAKLFIDMDFIDSIAGEDYFSVGIDGLGFVGSSAGMPSPPFQGDITPRKLRFPGRIQRRNLDIVLSDFTPNSLLIQAHRAKLLSIKITGETPMFGKLLRTSCSPDEVCLSDSISEASELYPNRQLGAYIESIRPPKFYIKQDELNIHFVGLTTFFLDDTKQTIGKIPFSTDVIIKMVTRSTRLQVSLHLENLVILEDLDFFDLPASSLNGFRDAVKGSIENLARQVLVNGIDLAAISRKFTKYGLSNFYLELLSEEMILLQADVDVYKLVFDSTNTNGNEGGGII